MDVLIFGRFTEARSLISKSVAQLGKSINIISVDNISQTIFALATNSFDLIIIHADQLDGGYTEIILQAKNFSPDASILFLTLFDNAIDEEKLLRDGIDYSFDRYFLFEEFIDTIKKVANRFLDESSQLSTIYKY
jgi:DNA-binding NarL/FixJ family response regulator